MKKRKLVLEQIEVESFDTSRGVAEARGTVMGHVIYRPDKIISGGWTDEWNGGCAETGVTVFCDPNCGDTVSDGPTGGFSCDLEDPTQVNC
ncbi:MAG TPA: hypothetical protein VM890_13105 [Longimicrobium sp.]|jgi:hypothetical protein|nr:hypothetical protein [Longimicrobium sp.]